MNPAQTTAGMQQNIIRPINTGQYYTQTSNVRLSGNALKHEAVYNMFSAISRSVVEVLLVSTIQGNQLSVIILIGF